ncbi:MAG: hypothetical protein IKP67_10445 [Spirochaetales bacterium]|nr:hypothetical protein [Spirochaetales bacterium]
MDCKINPDEDKPFLGKNIFFVHPNDAIHNELVMPVLRAEYQVFEIDTEDDVLEAARRYPDAVMFFCLANTKSEFSFSEHAKLIEKIWQISSRNNLRIGIICESDSSSLRRAALYNTGINAVIAPLSKGYDWVSKSIIKCLSLIGAKGVRRYVRALCDDEDNAVVTMTLGDNVISGKISDVSSVGFAVMFDADPDLQPDTTIPDTVLNIRSTEFTIPSRVFGVRQSDEDNHLEKEYIMLFDENVPVEKSPIYDYIYYCLRRNFKR